MNKNDLKQIHSSGSWGANRSNWAINPNRKPGEPYKKGVADSLSKEDRQRINDIKEKLTFGEDDSDPLFGE